MSSGTRSDLAAVFENGLRTLHRKEAVGRLLELTGVGAATAYRALAEDGPYARWLKGYGRQLAFGPATQSSDE